MFDSIMVRRTSPLSTEDHLDLGHLAEAMLFYRHVYLILTRQSMPQLIRQCGPELAVELVENTNLKGVRIDKDVAVPTLNAGTENERYGSPVTFKVVSAPGPISLPSETVRSSEEEILRLPDEAMIVKRFQEATGKDGKGRRLANRFLSKTGLLDFPAASLQESLSSDWLDGSFIRQALAVAIAELAPSYTLPSNIDVQLVQSGDGYYQFDSNLDWSAIRQASASPDYPLTGGLLLCCIANMRQNLYFSSQFSSSIAQDPMGEGLTRAKCVDLTAALDYQQAKIVGFQEVIVHGLTDIREAINSGSCSFREFLELLNEADSFRKWLDSQEPNADLIREYYRELNKKRVMKSPVVKHLRWLIPVTVGLSPVVPGAAAIVPDLSVVGPSLAAVLTAADQFVLERFAKGWKPEIFVDDKLRPFVSS